MSSQHVLECERKLGLIMKKENAILKEDNKEFVMDLYKLALPVTLQCLLQSSFSVVDQIMTGQLGSVSIAAIGLSGKFISLLTVMVQAISAVAGIIIAQAVGKKDIKEAGKGFYSNMFLVLILTVGFMIAGFAIPDKIMAVYSQDRETIVEAASYLRIYAISFLPMAITSLYSAYLRCAGAAIIPLYAGICAAVLNTGLNYVLIFGKFGFERMGVSGAAWASVIAQISGCAVTLLAYLIRCHSKNKLIFGLYKKKSELKNYMNILIPMFICEFLWILGENIYAYVYGHIGTKACAAMTLINPVVSLVIGALSGVSQAAGIMVGRALGEGENEKAFTSAQKLLKTGFVGSAILSLLLLLFQSYYVQMFNVTQDVRLMTGRILIAFAVVSPVKVQNMILGGGILRSGGKTKYIMVIDIIGTWIFGVPLAFFTAFLLKLPIEWVYFILSMEEGVRLFISFVLFNKRSWMQRL